MFDDHDQVRKGDHKRRFCAIADFRDLVFNALAVNLTTAGIPCIYYATEQAFDSGGRPNADDRYCEKTCLASSLARNVPKALTLSMKMLSCSLWYPN